MSYFGNGFVFTSLPPWEALAGIIPPAIALRGYAHRTVPLWLLDAWRPSKREHLPFTDAFPDRASVVGALPDATESLLKRFDMLCRALPRDEAAYGHGWLRATAAVASAAGVDTFFFAGDDELSDFACLSTPQGLARFRVRFGACSVEYDANELVIVPFEFAEDPDKRISQAAIDKVAAAAGAAVAPLRVIAGGLALYESAVTLWPRGDPGQLLGIGTWDPFQNVESDFTTAFERGVLSPSTAAPPTATTASRPWWRFWA